MNASAAQLEYQAPRVRTMTAILAAAVAAAVPQIAAAQPAPGAAGPLQAAVRQAGDRPPQPAPPVTAGWQDGFVVQSDDEDFRLQLGALVHADGRFALGDNRDAVADTFVMRRLRPNLRGRLFRRFEFYINPDLAGGTLVVQDAYLDTVFAPAFRLRVGKGKTPFGLERLQSSSNILFAERALPSALAPNRDLGVQVLGAVSGGRISYAGAVLNGVPDGGSADVDTSDGKDVVGRVFLRPFLHATDSPLHALGFGFAASRGHQRGAGALPSFRTALLFEPYFSYTGASADGVRTRYSPQASYFYGPFGALAEYVHSEVPVAGSAGRGTVAHDAWQLAASVVLTGEAATDSGAGVRPRANFDFGAGNWGAFQVAARYHALEVDTRAYDLGLAGSGSSRTVRAWTAGLNWILTPNFKYVVNFERTVFDDDADGARPAENALVFRTQVSF